MDNKLLFGLFVLLLSSTTFAYVFNWVSPTPDTNPWTRDQMVFNFTSDTAMDSCKIYWSTATEDVVHTGTLQNGGLNCYYVLNYNEHMTGQNYRLHANATIDGTEYDTFADTSFDYWSCGYVKFWGGGTITFPTDFNATYPNCFTMPDSFVILDCDGHITNYTGISSGVTGALINSAGPDDLFNCQFIGYNTGVYIRNSAYNWLENVSAEDGDFYGLRITESSDSNYVNHCTFTNFSRVGILIEDKATDNIINNSVAEYSLYGISITDLGTDNNSIQNSIIRYNDINGIRIKDSAKYNYIYNILSGSNGGAGFEVKNTTYNTIYWSGCLVSGTDCVLLNSSDYINVTNVTSIAAVSNGFELRDSDYNNLINLVSYQDGNHGLYMLYADHNIITNFNASNPTNNGIYLFRTSSNVFENNSVNNAGAWGTLVYESSYNNFTRSINFLNAEGGFEIDMASHNNLLIFPNSYDNLGPGFLFSRQAEYNYIVGGYALHNNREGYLFNSTTHHNSLGSSLAENNTADGIAIYNSNYNNVSNVWSYGNQWSGLYIDNSNGTRIVSDSKFYLNGWSGVEFEGAAYSNFTKAKIYNNTAEGLDIVNSNNNYFTNFSSYDNYGNGALFENTYMDVIDLANLTSNNLHGFVFDGSAQTYVTNSEAIGNGGDGFRVANSVFIRISDIESSLNTLNGLSILPGSHNNIINNTILIRNIVDGVYIQDAYMNQLLNTVESSSINGLYINNDAYENLIYNSEWSHNSESGVFDSGINTTITNSKIHNNNITGLEYYSADGAQYSYVQFCDQYGEVYQHDFLAVATMDPGGGFSLNASLMVFDSSGCNFVNYTTLDIQDKLNQVNYYFDWSPLVGAAPPAGTVDIANKFVSTHIWGGATTIGNVTWRWLDGEVPPGSIESRFRVFEYDGVDWTQVPSAIVNPATNTIRYENFAPHSVFELVENLTAPIYIIYKTDLMYGTWIDYLDYTVNPDGTITPDNTGTFLTTYTTLVQNSPIVAFLLSLTPLWIVLLVILFIYKVFLSGA
jgi:parallel beta-helix repeat protein